MIKWKISIQIFWNNNITMLRITNIYIILYRMEKFII